MPLFLNVLTESMHGYQDTVSQEIPPDANA